MFNYSKVYAALVITLMGYVATPLYFNRIIVYKGQENVKINQLRNLIQSEELEEKFTDLLNSRPIGFYYDTQNEEVYLNNYKIEKQHINPADTADFSKFLSLSLIDTKSPTHRLIKQTTAGSLDSIFRNKIPLASSKKATLFNIQSNMVESLLNKNKNEQTVKLERLADLNNDGIKEKLIFLFSYEKNEGDRPPLLMKLNINIATLSNNSWKIYDQFTLSSQQLERGLNNIQVFKTAKGRPALIYIDTETISLTGMIYRSQLFITTSNKNIKPPIIDVY